MAMVLGINSTIGDKYLSRYQPEIFSLGDKQHSNEKKERGNESDKT